MGGGRNSVYASKQSALTRGIDTTVPSEISEHTKNISLGPLCVNASQILRFKLELSKVSCYFQI